MSARDDLALVGLGVLAGLVIVTGLALWGGQLALTPLRWLAAERERANAQLMEGAR